MSRPGGGFPGFSGQLVLSAVLVTNQLLVVVMWFGCYFIRRLCCHSKWIEGMFQSSVLLAPKFLVFSVILPKGTIYTLNFKTLHWFEAQ